MRWSTATTTPPPSPRVSSPSSSTARAACTLVTPRHSRYQAVLRCTALHCAAQPCPHHACLLLSGPVHRTRTLCTRAPPTPTPPTPHTHSSHLPHPTHAAPVRRFPASPWTMCGPSWPSGSGLMLRCWALLATLIPVRCSSWWRAASAAGHRHQANHRRRRCPARRCLTRVPSADEFSLWTFQGPRRRAWHWGSQVSAEVGSGAWVGEARAGGAHPCVRATYWPMHGGHRSVQGHGWDSCAPATPGANMRKSLAGSSVLVVRMALVLRRPRPAGLLCWPVAPWASTGPGSQRLPLLQAPWSTCWSVGPWLPSDSLSSSGPGLDLYRRYPDDGPG